MARGEGVETVAPAASVEGFVVVGGGLEGAAAAEVVPEVVEADADVGAVGTATAVRFGSMGGSPVCSSKSALSTCSSYVDMAAMFGLDRVVMR